MVFARSCLMRTRTPSVLAGARRGRSALSAVGKSTGKFFVGGNWKCNGSTSSISSLSECLNSVEWDTSLTEVVCAPPYPYLPYARSCLKPTYAMAAQNCRNGVGYGAYTGEVSPEMLVDLAVPWVILGHSERRSLYGETNSEVGEKVKHALAAGLDVIFCVGESLEQREAGVTMETLFAQMEALKKEVETEEEWSHVVVAYEPVWAIGTGKVATPEQAQEVHASLREWLASNISNSTSASTRIIYGGSVNGSNCVHLASEEDIDGFLVGGASLKAEFGDIVKANEKAKEEVVQK